jgi:NAD(P)-dependent dehydrogenase (short-subunit alcohol dehydrogenase family)
MKTDQKKVILVTGASSGIGQRIASFLHEKGYRVYGTSRKPFTSSPFPFVILDVTDQESVDVAVNQIIAQEGRLDVLVNNAGLGIIGALEDTPMEDVYKIFETNVFGILRTCKAVLPIMRHQKSGLIINISSIAGKMGLPYRGIYSASKGAVELLTESLSMETTGMGIKVCSILPGDFATNINQNRVFAPSPENSPYKKAVDQMNKQVNDEVGNASDPIMVAKKVLDLIERKQPGMHYMIGAPLEKLSVQVKKYVTGRQFERILRKFYKL